MTCSDSVMHESLKYWSLKRSSNQLLKSWMAFSSSPHPDVLNISWCLESAGYFQHNWRHCYCLSKPLLKCNCSLSESRNCFFFCSGYRSCRLFIPEMWTQLLRQFFSHLLMLECIICIIILNYVATAEIVSKYYVSGCTIHEWNEAYLFRRLYTSCV